VFVFIGSGEAAEPLRPNNLISAEKPGKLYLRIFAFSTCNPARRAYDLPRLNAVCADVH
jgi:hypothetical protein